MKLSRLVWTFTLSETLRKSLLAWSHKWAAAWFSSNVCERPAKAQIHAVWSEPKLLIEHLLEFLSLNGGCTGSSESTLVKMPHCWKSHVMAQIMKLYHTLHYTKFLLHMFEKFPKILAKFYLFLAPFHFPCKIPWPLIYESWHYISNNVVCATSKGSNQPARILLRAFAWHLNILGCLIYWLYVIWTFY